MLLQKRVFSPAFLKHTQRITGILLLAIAYYGMAEVSRHLASTPQDVTPVWPPDGVAVGAVLIFGNWIGYGVFLGSFLANFWAFRDPSSFLSLTLSTLPVLGIALGTTLGTLLGAYLLQKSTHHRYPLGKVSDVFKFLFFAGMVGPVVNASVGVTCLAMTGKVGWSIYETVWLTWWISNVSGIFILTPVLLSWEQFIQHQQPVWEPWFSIKSRPEKSQPAPVVSNHWHRQSLRFVIEVVLSAAIMIALSELIFTSGYRLEYILIPGLIWSAFRLAQVGVTSLNFMVAAIAIIATVNGQGGFASSNLNQSLVQLQSFIGVITLTVLILTAIITERGQAETQLRLAFAELARTNETLESRVQQRTEELYEKNTTLEKTLETLRQTQLQMIHTEKMSALGQMVAGIAHEINNPVNFIYGNLGPIDEGMQSLLEIIQTYQTHYPAPPDELSQKLVTLDFEFLQEDLTKGIQSMEVGARRIRDIVLSLQNFSRLNESAYKAADLHEGLDNCLILLQHRFHSTATRPEIQIVKDYGSLPLVKCYVSSINQVFMHLLNNAIDAIEEIYEPSKCAIAANDSPPVIRIQTYWLDANRVNINVSDTGAGISDKIRAKLFDPFFTTKTIGKGTGLGLSISYYIVVDQHEGKLWCDSTVGQGTTFTIELPIENINLEHATRKASLDNLIAD